MPLRCVDSLRCKTTGYVRRERWNETVDVQRYISCYNTRSYGSGVENVLPVFKRICCKGAGDMQYSGDNRRVHRRAHVKAARDLSRNSISANWRDVRHIERCMVKKVYCLRNGTFVGMLHGVVVAQLWYDWTTGRDNATFARTEQIETAATTEDPFA